MTTTVILSSPKPNHQRVRVRAVSPADGTTYSEVILDEGQSTVFYVHDGARLVVDEAAKDAPGS